MQVSMRGIKEEDWKIPALEEHLEDAGYATERVYEGNPPVFVLKITIPKGKNVDDYGNEMVKFATEHRDRMELDKLARENVFN